MPLKCSRILQQLPAQCRNVIAKRRQSPVQGMSDRTTFYRSCERAYIIIYTIHTQLIYILEVAPIIVN
jgi:hypothetical protein